MFFSEDPGIKVSSPSIVIVEALVSAAILIVSSSFWTSTISSSTITWSIIFELIFSSSASGAFATTIFLSFSFIIISFSGFW